MRIERAFLIAGREPEAPPPSTPETRTLPEPDARAYAGMTDPERLKFALRDPVASKRMHAAWVAAGRPAGVRT